VWVGLFGFTEVRTTAGIVAGVIEVAGRLGTVTRVGGATQATYNGHPLYTYVGDTRPGQASGNNLNLSGGLWREVTISGEGQH
jgi:Secreted repeat of unknown function